MKKSIVRIAAVNAWEQSDKPQQADAAYKQGFEQGIKWLADKLAHTSWPKVMEIIVDTHKELSQ